MMHKAITSERWHRLYVQRKEGRRGFTSIIDSADESVQGLKDFIWKKYKGLFTGTRNSRGNAKVNRITNWERETGSITICIFQVKN